eukprot:SAG11_NODE_16191_length_554_cov_7.043956_1_plen_33_part_10
MFDQPTVLSYSSVLSYSAVDLLFPPPPPPPPPR